jgi:hypothetical protein
MANYNIIHGSRQKKSIAVSIKKNNLMDLKNFFQPIGQFNNDPNVKQYEKNNEIIEKFIDELIIYEEYFNQLMAYFSLEKDNILMDHVNNFIDKYITALFNYYQKIQNKSMVFFDLNMVAIQEKTLSIVEKILMDLKNQSWLKNNYKTFIEKNQTNAHETINGFLEKIFQQQDATIEQEQLLRNKQKKAAINGIKKKLSSKKDVYDFFSKPIELNGFEDQHHWDLYPKRLKQINTCLNNFNDKAKVEQTLLKTLPIIKESINQISIKTKEKMVLLGDDKDIFFQILLEGYQEDHLKLSWDSMVETVMEKWKSSVKVINYIEKNPYQDDVVFKKYFLEMFKKIQENFQNSIKIFLEPTAKKLSQLSPQNNDNYWSNSSSFLKNFKDFQLNVEGVFGDFNRQKNLEGIPIQYHESLNLLYIFFRCHFKNEINKFFHSNKTDMEQRKDLSGKNLKSFFERLPLKTNDITKIFHKKISGPITIEKIFKINEDEGDYCWDFSEANIKKTQENLNNQQYFNQLLLNIELIDIKLSQKYLSNITNFTQQVQKKFMVISSLIEDIHNYYEDKKIPQLPSQSIVLDKLMALDIFLNNPNLSPMVKELNDQYMTHNKNMENLLKEDGSLEFFNDNNKKQAMDKEINIYTKATMGVSATLGAGAGLMKLRQNLKQQGQKSKTVGSVIKTAIVDKNTRSKLWDYGVNNIKNKTSALAQVTNNGLKTTGQIIGKTIASTQAAIDKTPAKSFWKKLLNK